MTSNNKAQSPDRLGHAPLGRLLLALSLPGIASMITMALYNIIDTFWVSRLGYQAIAALSVYLPIQISVMALGGGSGIGIAALVSRSFGEGNREVANHTAGQIFPLAIVFGAVFPLAARFFSAPILTMLGATPDVLGYAQTYFITVSLGIPFLFLLILSNNLLRGSGDTLRPMIFSMAAQAVNMVLDPLMIFGIGPFSAMGVRGAALATVISQAVGAGLGLYYLLSSRSVFRVHLADLRPDRYILKGIYRVGSPVMVVDLMESIMFSIFNHSLSGFGSVAIAAGGIAIRIADLTFMPVFGAANALLPVIGYCFGAGLWSRLWKAVRVASLGLGATMALITVIFEVFAPRAAAIFSQDPALLAIATPAIRIALSSLAVFGPLIMFISTFEGLSRGKTVLVLSVIRQTVFFIPALVILSRLLGVTGIFISLPVSDFLGFLLAGLWLYREYRLHVKREASAQIDIDSVLAAD